MSGEKKHLVKGRYLPIRKVTVHQIREMYDLFSRYYDNVSLDVFTRDMSEKTGIILLWDKQSGRIAGFSTLTCTELEVNGKRALGVFSGDTILEREYWGAKALQRVFYLCMLKERLRRPIRPMFWLLISKGYKTYLLLANNFLRYYPDKDGRFDWLEGYVDLYCRKLFPQSFCERRRLIDFGEGYTHLKGDVTPITDEMRARSGKIRFFEQRNPTWQRGTELPCIGVVGYRDALRYPFLLLKKIRKSRRVQPVVAADDRTSQRPVETRAEVQYE
jgi:hypothetical protein